MWHHILWEFNPQLKNLYTIKEGNQKCIRKKEWSVKVFNKLPTYLRIESDNSKKFKLVLQNFSYENLFYSLDEYLELQKVKYIYIRF